MAKATPFDPAVSVVDTLYCTPTDDDRAFIYPYPGTTLIELNPNGTICKPGTLQTSPTTW
jgi:hypothetical protein